MRNFVLKSLVQDSGALRWTFNLEAIASNYSILTEFRNYGKPFSGPTAFIGGGNSRYISYVCTYIHGFHKKYFTPGLLQSTIITITHTHTHTHTHTQEYTINQIHVIPSC